MSLPTNLPEAYRLDVMGQPSSPVKTPRSEAKGMPCSTDPDFGALPLGPGPDPPPPGGPATRMTPANVQPGLVCSLRRPQDHERRPTAEASE